MTSNERNKLVGYLMDPVLQSDARNFVDYMAGLERRIELLENAVYGKDSEGERPTIEFFGKMHRD